MKMQILNPKAVTAVACLLTLGVSSAGAAVIVESSGFRTGDNNNWTSYSTSVDLGTASNRVFLAFVQYQGTGSVTDVTLNGASLLANRYSVEAGTNGRGDVFWAVAPTTGSVNFAVTKTSTRGQVSWFALSNAEQEAPQVFGNAPGRLADTTTPTEFTFDFGGSNTIVTNGQFVMTGIGSNSAAGNFQPSNVSASAGTDSQTLGLQYSYSGSLSSEYFATTTITGTGGGYVQKLTLPAFNGSRPNGVTALGAAVSVVPEPATLSLLALAGLTGLRRRR